MRVEKKKAIKVKSQTKRSKKYRHHSCRNEQTKDWKQKMLRGQKRSEIIKAEMRKQKMNYINKRKVEKGPEVAKDKLNGQKIKSRNKLLVEKGPIQIWDQENQWKKESRKRNIEVNPKETRNKENKKKSLSRKRQKMNDPHKVKEDQQRWHKKSRLIDSEKKRLKRFRERTMLNAIFTCSCCQKNLLDCNVCKWETKLITEIGTKRSGLYTSLLRLKLMGKSHRTYALLARNI